MTLTIHEFDVEFHQDCNYDVLEVRYGPFSALSFREKHSNKSYHFSERCLCCKYLYHKVPRTAAKMLQRERSSQVKIFLRFCNLMERECQGVHSCHLIALVVEIR